MLFRSYTDRATVFIQGESKNGRACVTLPQACYSSQGQFSLVIKLSLSGAIHTIFYAEGAVSRASTDTIVDTEHIIPSLDELLAQIELMESGTAAANSAAQAANTATSAANDAAGKIEGMTASAVSIDAGLQPTVSVTDDGEKKHISLGIPKGETGPQGAPGPEGPPGPKGDPGNGSGDVVSVNNVGAVSQPEGEDDGSTDVQTVNADTLGGKSPAYYISPPNLLDNSDFTNPVNQRGISNDSHEFAYTIDRWRIYGGTSGGTSGIQVTKAGVEISLGGAGAYFDQLVDIDVSKTYTFMLKSVDGLSFVTGVPSTGVENSILKMDVNSDGYVRCALIDTQKTYTLQWAALYEGEYTADNFPPYVPKGYATELDECRRYFITTIGKSVQIVPYLFGATERLYAFYFEEMRVSPTVSINEQTKEYYNAWGQSNATITLNSSKKHSILIKAQGEMNESYHPLLVLNCNISAEL